MLPKGVIATSFVMIYWQLRDTLSSVTQCQDATYSIPNRILTGHAFTTKPSATMESCVIFCSEDLNCKSINFYRKAKTCELNNMSAETSPESMVDFELAMYMANAFLMPCFFDAECKLPQEICELVEGGRKCKACMEALGMEDRRIPDSAISASSFLHGGFRPSLVRLNSRYSWMAAYNDPKSWLQIDLGRDAVIKKIATQGRPGNYSMWVKTYTLSSRANEETDWLAYRENEDVKVFQGNNDQETVVSHVLPQHIRARFVRFWPETWTEKYRVMRVELYGCFFQ